MVKIEEKTREISMKEAKKWNKYMYGRMKKKNIEE